MRERIGMAENEGLGEGLGEGLEVSPTAVRLLIERELVVSYGLKPEDAVEIVDFVFRASAPFYMRVGDGRKVDEVIAVARVSAAERAERVVEMVREAAGEIDGADRGVAADGGVVG